jgi:hypothetical protein
MCSLGSEPLARCKSFSSNNCNKILRLKDEVGRQGGGAPLNLDREVADAITIGVKRNNSGSKPEFSCFSREAF